MFEGIAVGVLNPQIVDKVVAIAQSLKGMNGSAVMGPGCVGNDAVNACGQDGLVRNAGLDRVDGRITQSSVAQQEFGGQVTRIPGRRGWGIQFGNAAVGVQEMVLLHAPEASGMEENAAIQITRWIQRQG